MSGYPVGTVVVITRVSPECSTVAGAVCTVVGEPFRMILADGALVQYVENWQGFGWHRVAWMRPIEDPDHGELVHVDLKRPVEA